MLDVDHFKRINDRFGHEAGDEVLRYTADVLRRTVRDEDVVCRYGGEEFAVLLPDIAPEVAAARAEAILDALRSHRLAYRGEALGPVTASVGVALFPAHGEEGADVLRRADEALYAAKRGRPRPGVRRRAARVDPGAPPRAARRRRGSRRRARRRKRGHVDTNRYFTSLRSMRS
jgi:diguanylate cyclase (GGDEF)-like protein